MDIITSEPDPSLIGLHFRDFSLLVHPRVQTQLITLLADPKSSSIIFSSFESAVPFHKFSFSLDTIRMLSLPNAGGHSENSEALSFEVLYRMFGAKLVKAEMEIKYDNAGWKKTDYSCTLFGHYIGVSVTRAVGFPSSSDFGPSDAQALLSKKLFGICVSNVGVSGEEKWERQILHVWCQNSETAKILQDVYYTLHADLRSNSLLLITVAGNHDWIFS
ncbi:putative Signal transducing adapter molecule 2 [Blattamonas nauphoetae]|uniref:Signal transducing adapter molecule 2 n=1 Tax=Blattamonas nauphoetae TaxID=2049346 RepID=A0ABQ9XSP4_9EUKA|nr:putative Signal transducing adapter molecule 2 [Blattamonas nauphoetae]